MFDLCILVLHLCFDLGMRSSSLCSCPFFWQLLVEFHSRFELDGPAKLARAQRLIAAAGYDLIHQTSSEEYSYVRFSDRP